MAVKQLDALPADFEPLFAHALRLVGSFDSGGIADPFWTFGGAAVLMLRYGHRKSRDLDIFVPDARYLALVNPRLNAVAESVSADFVEGPDFVKIVLPRGEIDFFALPNLTPQPFETWQIAGRPVRVETAAEIVARKMWHWGDRASARDIFDLAVVAKKSPDQITVAAPWFERHRLAFLAQIELRAPVLEAQFDMIDTIGFHRGYGECANIVARTLGGAAPAATAAGKSKRR
jgi:hypothetical protein